MDEFAESLSPKVRRSEKTDLTDETLYSEDAVWLCENRKTRFKTRVHGALAQILRKYPDDYKLKFLSAKGDRR